jgi:hypothetical protein
MKRIFLIGACMMIVILSLGIVCQALPTSAVTPIVTNSKDDVYNMDMFVTTFSDINDFWKYHESYTIHGNTDGSVGANGGSLDIDAGSSSDADAAKGRNGVKSRPLYYSYDRFYGTHPIYTIETTFEINSLCGGMLIVDSNDLIIFVSGTVLKAHVRNNDETANEDKIIHTLTMNMKYDLYIEAYYSTYKVSLNTDADAEYEVEEEYEYSLNPHMDYFYFGDRGGVGLEDYGEASWYYFRLRGHGRYDVNAGLSDVKFFDSFNDKNAENWRFNSVSSLGGNNPDSMYLKNIGDEYVDDYCLEFKRTNIGLTSIAVTIAKSPYIDIVDSHEYSISLDFYARHASDYKFFILLSDNNQVFLYLDTETVNGVRTLLLKALVGDPPWGTKETVATIVPEQWYFLNIHRNGNLYSIFLNQDFICTKNIFNKNNPEPVLRFGDATPSDYFDLVRIDNVMVRQDSFLSADEDTDGDQMSDAFEQQPYTPILYEDFEYSLPFEEYGWQHVIRNDLGNDQVWDVGFADANVVDDPTFGMSFGLPNDGQQIQHRSMILGSSIGNPYPKVDILLKSPIIELPQEGLQQDDRFYNIVLESWVWYDFAFGLDGARIYLEVWDISDSSGSPNKNQIQLLTAAPDGDYDHNDILALGTPGFTGQSNGWKKVKFQYSNSKLYPSSKVKCCRIVIEMQTIANFQEGVHYGLYMDNIKMFMTMGAFEEDSGNWRSDSDSDNDGLSDGTEWYKYGTSPMIWDCDRDGILDADEMTSVAKFGQENGGDPQYRNVFVEFDYLKRTTGVTQYNYRPDDSEGGALESIQTLLKDHEILFYYHVDDAIDYTDSFEVLNARVAEQTHGIPVQGNTDTKFTYGRENIWRYCLYAHKNKITDGAMGRSSNGHMSILYVGEWPANKDESVTLLHELGHQFGLYDYYSSADYKNPPGKPPNSAHDYGRMDSNPLLDYLGEESNYYYECLEPDDEYEIHYISFTEWGPAGNMNWRYGGWQFAKAHGHFHATDADDGNYIGGLEKTEVVSFT